MQEKILIGSDHGGFQLKEKLKKFLSRRGFAVKDAGSYSGESCDYPDVAFDVAGEVGRNKTVRGILICKSGIGNSIAANKVPGVRAALCYTPAGARLSRKHNDSNVLVLGSLFSTEEQARRIVSAWLATEFEGGRHRRRVDKIRDFEKKTLEGNKEKR